MLREERVQVWQQAVPVAERRAHLTSDLVAKEVWLATFGLELGVRAEKGMKDCDLVPAHEQRGRRVAEEAADVGAHKRDAREREAEEHGRARCQMRPRRLIVASPDRRGAL